MFINLRFQIQKFKFKLVSFQFIFKFKNSKFENFNFEFQFEFKLQVFNSNYITSIIVTFNINLDYDIIKQDFGVQYSWCNIMTDSEETSDLSEAQKQTPCN